MNLLLKHDIDIREQAVWALGNIAGDCAKCRDYVLSLSVLFPLLQVVQSKSKVTIIRNATWTISNLCRHKPIPELAQVNEVKVPLLSHNVGCSAIESSLTRMKKMAVIYFMSYVYLRI